MGLKMQEKELVSEVKEELVRINESYLKSNGLVLPEDLPFETWLSYAPLLRKITNASLWWWGDYIRFGERKYGEMYSQALEESDYSYGTLKNAVWICDKFELSRRHDNLTMSHHAEVAGVEEKEIQDRFLEECGKEGWTQHELRGKVRKYKKELDKANGVQENPIFIKVLGVDMDLTSPFYKNCRQQRHRAAKICDSCPFRTYIEEVEKGYVN